MTIQYSLLFDTLDIDWTLGYDGLDWRNFFLIGVESSHSNTHEDRKFQLFYAASTKYHLEGCTWSTESLNHETLQVPSSGQQTTWGIKNIKLLIK